MAVRGTGRRTRRGGRRDRRDRRPLRLALCIGAFLLLLTAGRISIPDGAAAVRERLGAVFERDMDVEAVFSSLGSWLAGGREASEVGREVWQAVSGTGGEDLEVFSGAAGTLSYEDGAAWKALREARSEDTDPPSGDGDGVSDGAADGGGAVPGPVRDLPEDVRMEQALLGFEYCTPVLGALTSRFGWRGDDSGGGRFHRGLDLAAEEGSPILCFAAGSVTAVAESTSYGDYCVVAHEGGFSTLYAHCSRILVSAGDPVSMGQKIAEVGQTGDATGPHLHFSLSKDGLWYDPIYYVAHG